MAAYAFGPFTLNSAEHRLSRGGQPIELTPKVFETLELLVEARGGLVSREQFQAKLWPDTVVEERNLTVNISTLRKALADDTVLSCIETVPKVGYRIAVPVRRLDEVAVPRTAPTTPRPTPIQPSAVPPAPAREWWPQAARALAAVLALGAIAAGVAYVRKSVTAAAPVRSSAPRVAVLPFVVAAGAPDDVGLGLGITDAVVSRLDGIEGLAVLPFSAVLPYANGGDPVAIGRSLGVDRVVEGVVERSGDRAQVTSRILDVESGKVVWSDRFERPYEGLFALQDAVSAAVAGSLMQRVLVERIDQHYPRRPSNSGAYRAYLEGRMHMARLNISLGEAESAVGAYHRSLALDESFAPAWAALSRAARVLFLQKGPSERRRYLDEATTAAERAITLDPGLSEGYVARGILKYTEWDWPGAEADFRRAVDLSPQSEDALTWLGNLVRGLGREEEALGYFARARDANPISARDIQIYGEALWYADRIDDALGMLDQAARLDPSNPTPYWLEVEVLDSAGRQEAALAARRRAATAAGDKSFLAMLDAAEPRGYRAVLESERIWRRKHGTDWDVIALSALVGDKRGAVDALERCASAFCGDAPTTVADPRLRSLYDYPPYQAVVERLHLTDVLNVERGRIRARDEVRHVPRER